MRVSGSQNMTKSNKTASYQAFIDLIGAQNVIQDDDPAQKPFLEEWRGLYHGRTPLVLLPQSTEQVAAIVRLAQETSTPLVTQGGNTGLVGGQIPDEDNRQIVLSLKKMNRIRTFDPVSASLTAEAGVILQHVQDYALKHNLFFPLSMASEGSCTLGGNLATNAGGINVLAYGNMRDLTLGLECVTASGEIISALSPLRKDNAGYDWKQLLIGSEGTLGIITAATVKLFPRPKGQATAFIALDSPAKALALFTLMRRRAGFSLTSFEIMPRFGLDLILTHIKGARDPFKEPAPWYVLCDITSLEDQDRAQTQLQSLIQEGWDNALINNAVFSQSEEQRQALWLLRERLSEAQKLEGGSIKHDISVPLNTIPDFLHKADQLARALVPGCRPLPFGHMGDGNIHFNVSQPVSMAKEDFLQFWEPMTESIHALVTELQGSIAAEHGIGRMKRSALALAKNDAEMALMRRIKAAFDPNGIFNPHKIV
jgi:FAD/FMN-containing dehydrogenase